MDLIGVLLAVSVVLLAAHLSADYTKAWLTRIIDRLIDRAIKRLPHEQRDRFAEEWKGYVNDTLGDLRKLIVAVGFLSAAKEMAGRPRWYDRVGAALLLVFCAPLLFFIAVMIATGGGPVLLRQGSVRADGKRIRRLRFRTIVADPEMLRAISEGAKPPSKEDDPRLTVVGRVLCAIGIDLLPLLLNVLKGDMSLLAVRQEFAQELFFRQRTMEATHKERGWSWFWAGAAGFVVVLGSLSLTSTLSEHTFPQVAEPSPRIAEVSRITRSDTDADKHEMNDDPLVTIIVGPRLGGTRATVRQVRDVFRERKLVTYIDTACGGECSVLFMAGVQRLMAPEAKLDFDRGTFPGITDAKLAQENEAVFDRRAMNGLREALTNIPIIRIRNCDEDRGIQGCRGPVGLFGRPPGPLPKGFANETEVWAWFADRASALSIQWPTSELREAGVITGVASPNDLQVWLGLGWLRQGTAGQISGQCKMQARALGTARDSISINPTLNPTPGQALILQAMQANNEQVREQKLYDACMEANGMVAEGG